MKGQLIGYARVSTKEQSLDLQLDALKHARCNKIFSEKISGVSVRDELDKALVYLREGDTFVIWKLDRLGRSLKDLVSIIDSLRERGIAFKSLQDGIDTSSAMGRMQFGIFAALAEYEREIIIERTKAGLQAAKERGRLGGRKKGLSEEAKKKAKTAKTLYEAGKLTAQEICEMIGIKSKATLYRYLRSERTKIKDERKGKRKK